MNIDESRILDKAEFDWNALQRGKHAFSLLEYIKAKNQIDIIFTEEIEMDEPNIYTYSIEATVDDIPQSHLEEMGFLIFNIIHTIIEFAKPDFTEGIILPDYQPIIMQDLEGNYFTSFAFTYTDEIQGNRDTFIH